MQSMMNTGHGDGYACCYVHVKGLIQYKGRHSIVQLAMAEVCCNLGCENKQSQRTF